MLEKLIDSLISALQEDIPEIRRENFKFPGNFEDVDISCNISFVLAKKQGRDPFEVSAEISDKIVSKLPDTFLPLVFHKEGKQSPYLNFYLDYSKLFEGIVRKSGPKTASKTVLVEFSNPNPCKAMHIGNARTTVLGDSISEILGFCGRNVIRANYYNDLGKQFAKVVFAVRKYGVGGEGKFDHILAKIYVRLHEDMKAHPEWEGEIQALLNRLEANDPALEEERKFVLEGVVKAFGGTYERLGIDFDVYFYESKFREKGKEIAKLLEKKGHAFYSDEGTLVAGLEKSGLPNIVLLRSDGTGLYITADLALAIHRFEEFGLDECVWVVGSEQNLYFKQLFKVLELLGCPFADRCTHMSYGMVTLEGSKMSSRSGEFILLDEMIDEIIERAKGEVLQRHPDMPEDEVSALGEKIGVGALKYDLLKVDRFKNVDFNPQKAVQFEGNTGPYIQYMVVRCRAILRKAGGQKREAADRNYNPNDHEKALLRKFIEFGAVAERAAGELKPSLVCNYAFELATVFSRFYENCKVIGSEEESFRLRLVEKTKEMLETCLGLLRIEAPEVM
ncbi:MAG: arginine--tRNA ligase [Candidatus Aenigmatarchaeota archaeon]